MWESTKTKKII